MVGPIQEFFREHRKAAIAFSGGVDSSFLLCAGIKSGADVQAYYIKSAFQPEFEQKDAFRIAKQLNAPLKVLEIDVLCDAAIASNPPNRCYFCKYKIFKRIREACAEDGYELILDGTNASDDLNDRPGMKALRELNIRSPLYDYGYTKERIRSESKELGLFTWCKPAYACLATRIKTNEEITSEKLAAVEKCEAILFQYGLRDIRVRVSLDTAKIQASKEDFEKIMVNREEILNRFEPYFSSVVLDLKPR